MSPRAAGGFLVLAVACAPGGDGTGETPSDSATDTDAGTGADASIDTGTSELGPCEGDTRAGALVFGPTDLGSAALLEAQGYAVTVWDNASWRAASREDFAAFAIIDIGEQSCSGPDQGGELGVLVETAATWNAAVDGRVLVSGIDAVCHITDWESTAGGDASYPALFYGNAIAWLDEGCGTALHVATDWGRRELAHLSGFGPFTSLPERGEQVFFDEVTHPVFDEIPGYGLNNWGSTYHSVIPTWPDEFAPLAVSAGDEPVLLTRPAALDAEAR